MKEYSRNLWKGNGIEPSVHPSNKEGKMEGAGIVAVVAPTIPRRIGIVTHTSNKEADTGN